MIRSIALIIGMVLSAGMMFVAVGGDEPAITARHAKKAQERKADIRPCDGLWIRQCAAGECWSPKPPLEQCSPSSDLTAPRALPSYYLTSPL